MTRWRRPLGTPTLPTPELKEQQSRGGGDPILPCVVVVPSPWESGKSSGSREVSALSEGHRARPTGRGGHAGPRRLAPAPRPCAHRSHRQKLLVQHPLCTQDGATHVHEDTAVQTG